MSIISTVSMSTSIIIRYPPSFPVIFLSVFTLLNILSNAQVFEYYGCQNTLSWSNAEDYCNKHCNSSLISIHSSTENTELQEYCSTVLSNTESNNCWIGATDATVEGTWVWSDGTTFNYGTDISGGVLPWGTGEPNNDGDQDCGTLVSAWDDYYCINTVHFLCNHCNLTLSKYILVNSAKNQSNANQYCRDTFGTELATIQSEADYQEAKLLCNYTGSNCWIGLYDYNTESSWEWEDGTQNLDFWTNSSGSVSGYPWIATQPDNSGGIENCVELWTAYDLEANDNQCSVSNTFLCNSALDNYICDINVQRGLWSDLSCNWVWQNKSDGCGVTQNDFSFSGCVTWLGNSTGLIPYKSWTDMVVEVTFAFTSVTGDAGILIRAETASATNDGGQQYYVALYMVGNAVILGKMNDGWTPLASVGLNFTAAINTYYNVRCELIGGSFNIYV